MWCTAITGCLKLQHCDLAVRYNALVLHRGVCTVDCKDNRSSVTEVTEVIRLWEMCDSVLFNEIIVCSSSVWSYMFLEWKFAPSYTEECILLMQGTWHSVLKFDKFRCVKPNQQTDKCEHFCTLLIPLKHSVSPILAVGVHGLQRAFHLSWSPAFAWWELFLIPFLFFHSWSFII